MSGEPVGPKRKRRATRAAVAENAESPLVALADVASAATPIAEQTDMTGVEDATTIDCLPSVVRKKRPRAEPEPYNKTAYDVMKHQYDNICNNIQQECNASVKAYLIKMRKAIVRQMRCYQSQLNCISVQSCIDG